MNIEIKKTAAISALALTMGALGGTLYSNIAFAQVAPPPVPQTPGATSPADGAPGDNGKSPASTSTQTTTTTTTNQTPPPDDPMRIKATGSMSMPFGKMDSNADGKISRDEMKADAKMNDKFDTMDRNRDGFLAQDEFSVEASAKAKREKPKLR